MKKTVRKPPKPTAADFLREGNASFRAGRYYLAAEAFEKARKLEPRNAAILFNLASTKERIGEIAEAAALLTQAARFKPSWPEPPARLALLAATFRLDSCKDLDPHGLLAAFAFDTVDRRALATYAFDHLRALTPLGAALESIGKGDDADEIARGLILRRTERVLSDRLFIEALSSGPIFDINIERLLTAIRKILLLEAPADRFEDKALSAFTLALIRQCMSNDHVFAVSEEERQRLDTIEIDWNALASGDAEAARLLMLKLLYAPLGDLVPVETDAETCKAIRPRGLGELLAE